MKIKKNVIPKNYLDKIPSRAKSIEWTTDGDGIVTLEIKNTGWANKIAQVLFKRPKISYIHLDKMGSFIWPIMDGKKDIMKACKPYITPADTAVGDEKHQRQQIGYHRREEGELFVKCYPQHHRNGEQVLLQIFTHVSCSSSPACRCSPAYAVCPCDGYLSTTACGRARSR